MNDFIDRGREESFTSCLKRNTVCCRKILETGTSAAAMDRWYRSPPSTSRWEYGSPRLERYNGLPSMEILGQAAPGKSTGEAMNLMEQLASKLPSGIGYDWTGMSYQNDCPANRALPCMPFHLIVVFCVWQRCTRAGQFRSPLCWWYHWVIGAHCWQQRSAA